MYKNFSDFIRETWAVLIIAHKSMAFSKQINGGISCSPNNNNNKVAKTGVYIDEFVVIIIYLYIFTAIKVHFHTSSDLKIVTNY